MESQRLINKYVYGVFILMLGVSLFLGIREFLNSFLGALVFYTLFKNFMNYLTRKKKFGKAFSAVIIIVISFIIVVLPIGFLFTIIYNRISAIVQNPESITQLIDKFMGKLREMQIDISSANFKERAQTTITQNLAGLVNSSLGILGSVLMMYFFLFFLLININKMEASIIYYLPFKRSKILLFGRELMDQTYSNAIGVPLISVAQGFLAYLSYVIAGVPQAGLWGILTGFASIVPLVGTALIWVPVSLYLFIDSAIWRGIFVSAYSLVIMTNVDNLIRMVVSRRIGDVHPVITVLGVIIGLKYFGLPGLVFGPLVISYFIILIKLYYIEYYKLPETRIESPKDKKGFMRVFLEKLSRQDTGPRPKPPDV